MSGSPAGDQGSNISFANVKGARAAAAGLFLLSAALGAASFAWGWCHLTYPATPGVQAVASVGHRPVTILFSLLMVLAAIRIGLMVPTSAMTGRLVRWTRLAALILGLFVLWDLSSERSRAIGQLVTNTANQLHLSVQTVQAAIDAQIAAGLIRVSFAPGIALAGLAAITCIVAGFVARSAAREPEAEEEPIAPQGPATTVPTAPGSGLDEAALRLAPPEIPPPLPEPTD